MDEHVIRTYVRRPEVFVSGEGCVVRDADGPVVVFDEFLPGRAVLVPVLRGLRHVLYGEPEEGATLAERLAARPHGAAAQ